MKSFFSILLFLVLYSCCREKCIETISFSESELAVNPYNGNETITFIDSTGNTMIFGDGYRRTSQNKISQCDGGCCDYYYLESPNLTVFTSSFDNSSLQICIYRSFNQYTGTRGDAEISIKWINETSHDASSRFYVLPINTMKSDAISQSFFYDSLSLLNRTYYNVYALPGNTIDTNSLHGKTLYYTTSEGIVGMKLSNGTTIRKQ